MTASETLAANNAAEASALILASTLATLQELPEKLIKDGVLDYEEVVARLAKAAEKNRDTILYFKRVAAASNDPIFQAFCDEAVSRYEARILLYSSESISAHQKLQLFIDDINSGISADLTDVFGKNATVGKILPKIDKALTVADFTTALATQDWGKVGGIAVGYVVTELLVGVLTGVAVAVGGAAVAGSALVAVPIAIVAALAGWYSGNEIETEWFDEAFGTTEDETIAQRVERISKMLSSSDRSYIADYKSTFVFGGESDDTITASAGVDNAVFALSGSDLVIGSTGNDYISGGDGSDTLEGGSGNDGLDGGSGNDSLMGGVGSDELNGGTGYDIYKFSTEDLADNSTIDIIHDADGDGSITFNSLSISGTGIGFDNIRHASLGAWETADGAFRIALVGAGTSTQSLLIIRRLADGKAGGQILVKNWSNGDLGITLPGIDEPPILGGGLLGTSDDLFGTNGDNAGDNIVSGLSGNDGLSGGTGDDRLDGGAGDDLIFGFSGEDELYGGDGNDYLLDGSESVDMREWREDSYIGDKTEKQYNEDEIARLGASIIMRGKAWYVFQSGSDSDTIATTSNFSLDPNQFASGDDLLDGGAGNDTLRAGEGNDILIGGIGNDLLDGGHDDDTISGGDDNDRIFGDANEEAIPGMHFTLLVSDAANRNGNDIIDAGAGDDYAEGNGGNDFIYGGVGNDQLFGRGESRLVDQDDADKDYIDGGDGVDQITGDDGDDTLLGGAGNDVIRGDNEKDEVRAGKDTIDGGDGDDLLIGDGGDDVIVGGAGADQLQGDDVSLDGEKHGNDMLSGGEGNDLIIGQGGNDVLNGDAGDDELQGDASESQLAAEFHGDDHLYGGKGNDRLFGGNGNDVLDGGADEDELSGGAGDDTLMGGSGDDQLDGGEGSDVLRGDAGDDILSGREGNDTLLGGDGVDSLSGNEGDDTLDGGNGNDTLFGGMGSDVISGGAGVDSLVAGDGDDYVDGGSEDDALWGESGNDILSGGSGQDTLYGGDGNDTLSGGDGNDGLVGGAGNDAMEGGAGNNTYYFDRGFGSDIIDLTSGSSENVVLQDGMASHELAFSRLGDDLVVKIVGQPDQVLLQGFFLAGIQAKLHTSDGFSYTSASFGGGHLLGTPIHGTSSAESLQGTSGSDRIYGFDGDDVIAGLDGDDYLDGGAGNDTLSDGSGSDTMQGGAGGDVIQFSAVGGSNEIDAADGGTGNDTYQIAWHSGRDVIANLDAPDAGVDTIVLSQVTQGMITNYQIAGNDLTIMIGDVGNGTIDNVLTLQGFLATGAPAHVIQFSDSSTLTAADFRLAYWTGTSGGDTFTGGLQPDSASGGGGNDILHGGGGADKLYGEDGNDELHGDEGDDHLWGGNGSDTLYGGSGNDTFYGDPRGENDLYYGGVGDDMYVYRQGSYLNRLSIGTQQVKENENEGHDVLVTDYHTASLASNVEDMLVEYNPRNLQYDNYGQIWKATYAGNDLSNKLQIVNPESSLHEGRWYVLDGMGGADVLMGGRGNDTYVLDCPEDTIIEMENSSSIDTAKVNFSYSLVGRPELENIELYGGSESVVTETGNDGSNVLDTTKALGEFTLIGGKGNDVYRVGFESNSQYQPVHNIVVENAGEGYDAVEFSIWDIFYASSNSTYYSLGYANIEEYRLDLRLPGGNIVGSVEEEILRGNAGRNTLDGGDGNDTLYSGGSTAGATDILIGGAGNDELYSEHGGSTTITGGNGSDTSHLGSGAETIIFARGDGHDVIVGSDVGGNDNISFSYGIDPQNVLWARSGADLLITFADAPLDSIIVRGYWTSEQPGAPVSGVIDTFTFSNGEIRSGDFPLLGNHAPMATASQSGFSIERGNSASLPLAQIVFNDIDGDALVYSLGADAPEWLQLDPTTGILQVVVPNELSVDQVQATVQVVDPYGATASCTLVLDIFNSIIGTSGNDALVGTTHADIVQGLAGDDTLDGSGGGDRLVGGEGNDTYIVRNNRDQVIELADSGYDIAELYEAADIIENVEKVVLVEGGNAFSAYAGAGTQTLVGNSGANFLDGGSGADVMRGMTGDDTYYVDDFGDQVVEAVGQGVDSIFSSIGVTLPDNVENLYLTHAANGTGNALDNDLGGSAGSDVLSGGAGNDEIDGDAGDDALIGGSGNDTYWWSSGFDSIDNTGGGTDKLIFGSKQSLMDLTFEQDGNDLLIIVDNDPEQGVRVLGHFLGGDNALDSVGIDGGSSYSTAQMNAKALGYANLVQGSANSETLNGTSSRDLMYGGSGNDILNGANGDDYLLGESGNDTLNGGGGIDKLEGGVGDDIYIISDTLDVVIENIDEGNDLVNASVSYSLGDNLERLTLTGTGAINGTGNVLDNQITGNSAGNTLNGGAGNDTLNGGAGNDTLIGGPGNDTYVVDSTGDTVTELTGEGIDVIRSSVTYTLGSNVENLTLTGSSTRNGTGNALDNVLTGNSANNILTGGDGNDTIDGGLGSDTMVGGLGDDTYVVNATADVVTEQTGQGTDTVRSLVTLTLANNVENLILTGTGAINGTGNALDNVLTGNSGTNSLTGAAGSDTLDGAGGTDSLTGGTGADTYLHGRGYGADTTVENDATAGITDVARFLTGVSYDQLWFAKPSGTNNLEISIIGTSDKLTIKDWYRGSQYQIEEIRTTDGNYLLTAAKVQALVTKMATMTKPTTTTLTTAQRSQLDPVFTTTWVQQAPPVGLMARGEESSALDHMPMSGTLQGAGGLEAIMPGGCYPQTPGDRNEWQDRIDDHMPGSRIEAWLEAHGYASLEDWLDVRTPSEHSLGDWLERFQDRQSTGADMASSSGMDDLYGSLAYVLANDRFSSVDLDRMPGLRADIAVECQRLIGAMSLADAPDLSLAANCEVWRYRQGVETAMF